MLHILKGFYFRFLGFRSKTAISITFQYWDAADIWNADFSLMTSFILVLLPINTPSNTYYFHICHNLQTARYTLSATDRLV
jgi:hypothetical protein